jgi:putative heme iron utilization protein
MLIAEDNPSKADPQTLTRISIQGFAQLVSHKDAEHATARHIYTAKFPEAAFLFRLGDFRLYRIEVSAARYVAGFGRIHNLRTQDFLTLSQA